MCRYDSAIDPSIREKTVDLVSAANYFRTTESISVEGLFRSRRFDPAKDVPIAAPE
jgi:hypothetical protein